MSEMSAPFPNLFVAGMSRAGTTSLHNFLSSHPFVDGGKTKEKWVYNVRNRFPTRKELFSNEFSQSPHSRYRLDSTPHYFDGELLWESRPGVAVRTSRENSIRKILDDVPNSKFIISLRHPVSRFTSEYLMNRYKGKPFVRQNLVEHAQACLRGEVEANADYLSMSRYGKMIDFLDRNVSRNNWKVIIQEEWVKSTADTALELAEFLSLDSSLFDRNIQTENTGKKYQTGGLGLLTPSFKPVSDLANIFGEMEDELGSDLSLLSQILRVQAGVWESWDAGQFASALVSKLSEPQPKAGRIFGKGS